MVRLTKIYTKTGDDGTTGLGDGRRVGKDEARVAAYGDVDEANAAVGVAVVEARRARGGKAIAALLETIQHDLFDCGADLCCPAGEGEAAGSRLRVVAAQVDRLERAIDRFNDPMPPLESFVLPGGTALSASLHAARTVTRRAERSVVTLKRVERGAVNPAVLRYLNRLSDLLFVLGRSANRLPGGAGDVLWLPGANRPTEAAARAVPKARSRARPTKARGRGGRA